MVCSGAACLVLAVVLQRVPALAEANACLTLRGAVGKDLDHWMCPQRGATNPVLVCQH